MKMKRRLLFLIQQRKSVKFIFLILVVIAVETKVIQGQSLTQSREYPKEPGVIPAGSKPSERLVYLEDHGVQYQCVQKCYPIMKPEPIPPPVTETPPAPPPALSLKRPTLRPPMLTIKPKILPKVVPMTYCQLVCLRYPYSVQCSKCKRPFVPRILTTHQINVTIPIPSVSIAARLPPPKPISFQPAPQVIFNTMRCCYMDRCMVLPIQPACPSVCYEPCDAICTGRCLPNPTCPNKCTIVAQQLREYKIKFMIWLHSKLDSIKMTHRQMVEACILRTRAHYVSEIKELQSQIKAAHPFLYSESNGDVTSMRRSMSHGISINIMGQQNVGKGAGGASDKEGGSSAYHVNQNIGISNYDPAGVEIPEDPEASSNSTMENPNAR